MQFVIDCRGQDVSIRSSGMRGSAGSKLRGIDVRKARTHSNSRPQWLVPAAGGWAVGQLFGEASEVFARPILTSNFDPLPEASLRKSGAGAASIFLAADGRVHQCTGAGRDQGRPFFMATGWAATPPHTPRTNDEESTATEGVTAFPVTRYGCWSSWATEAGPACSPGRLLR